jgi:tetratricopeptide (TPR) repeat protein
MPNAATQDPQKPDHAGVVDAEQSDNFLHDTALTKAARLTSEGNYYGERGNLDRAIQCFQRAISAKPDHVPAHLALATAYREKREYQRALEVLSSAPSESDAGDPMNFAFEIAFQKASVLIAKYRRTGFQEEMPDLVAALEQAREIGRRPTQATEPQRTAARALGMDLEAERQEKMSMIDGLLFEIRSPHGS